MKRGLKRMTGTVRTKGRYVGRREHPDEEGTETWINSTATAPSPVRRREHPDEEGTETGKVLVEGGYTSGRREHPDEEGTETPQAGCTVRSICAAAESTPMKRGLKRRFDGVIGGPPCQSRREHPDEEGTETKERMAPAKRGEVRPQRAPR